MTSTEPAQVISLPAALNRAWVEEHQGWLSGQLRSPVVLDFSAVTSVDSAGLAFIWRLQERLRVAGVDPELRQVPESVASMLQSWRPAPRSLPAAQRSSGFLESLGDAGLRFWEQMSMALSMLVEMLYWSSLGLRKRRDMRRGALGDQMFHLGFKAFGIVTLLAFLIGIVLALQSALFLKAYGAGIFLSQMVGWTMIREFGPLMTAVILAGRTGSATTAEIATMGVGEEIDALKTMGINPIQYVVTPKLWAMTLTMPILAAFASAIGIFGAYVVSLLYLDISSSLFLGELSKNIFMRDVRAGFIKSVVFAWLIIWVGAYFGFRVRGGAEEVGRETTASVVACIFVIILADAIFSFLL